MVGDDIIKSSAVGVHQPKNNEKLKVEGNDKIDIAGNKVVQPNLINHHIRLLCTKIYQFLILPQYGLMASFVLTKSRKLNSQGHLN